MEIHLQCWYFGRLTINLKIDNVQPTTKVIDLLNIYFNKIINPNTNAAFTWEYCHPKMGLCGQSDVVYDKSKTLAECGFTSGVHAFTVLTGFNY